MAMKLAEALQERADLNRTIEQLKTRLSNVALVQEGEEPVENPTSLKAELDACISRLIHLMTCINQTNSKTVVYDHYTLTELIARKDALTLKLHIYRDVAYEGSRVSYRARNTEIKLKSSFSIPEWQAEIDQMSKELRQLNNQIQQCNWTTELME